MNELRIALLVSVLWTPAAAFAQARADVPVLSESAVVELALAHNPALRTAMLELESARAAVTAEEGRYPLTLLLDAGATRTKSPRLTRAGVRTAESYDADAGAELQKRLATGADVSARLGTNVGLARASADPTGTFYADDLGPGYGLLARIGVRQPLLRGAGSEVVEAELNAARAQRTVAERTRARVASELLRSVLEAYWELWYANASVAIEAQSRALAVSQRDDARARANTGSLAPAEVLTFETRVAVRDESVLGAELERTRRGTLLAQQLGDAGQRMQLAVPNESAPPMPELPPGDSERRALDHAGELRELQAAVELARLRARTADDPLQSRLDLDAYVQAEGLGNEALGPAGEQLGKLGAVSAHVGVTYEAALDDRARSATAAQARLAIDLAETRLAEAEQRVVADVRMALANEAAARRRLELAEQSAAIAQRQLEAAQARFQTGSTTPLAVVEAEEEVRTAKLRAARARTDAVLASLRIQHLSGDLLARHASSRAARGRAGSGDEQR